MSLQQSREKILYRAAVLGVIWTLFVTAGAGISILRMNDKLEESCEARQSARTAIRVLFVDDPDWNQSKQEILDTNLPAKVKC